MAIFAKMAQVWHPLPTPCALAVTNVLDLYPPLEWRSKHVLKELISLTEELHLVRMLISMIFAPLATLQAISAHQVLLSNICVHQDITAAPILAGLLHVQQAPTALLGERHPAHAKLVHLDITALRVQFNLLFVQLATFVEILWT